MIQEVDDGTCLLKPKESWAIKRSLKIKIQTEMWRGGEKEMRNQCSAKKSAGLIFEKTTFGGGRLELGETTIYVLPQRKDEG